MNIVQYTRSLNLSCKTMMIFILAFSCEVTLVNSASAQNPWGADSRPLIEEGSQLSTNRNTWQDKALPQAADEFDESKYPPLEEDRTLGTGIYGDAGGDSTSGSIPDYSSADGLKKFDPQSLGEVPTYPGSNRGYSGGNFGNYQNPGLYNRYQPGYMPGNLGMNSMPFGRGNGSGFPFGGGSGSGFPFSGGNGSGFPFGGGSGSGSPFGGNNGWMPFSNSGFW